MSESAEKRTRNIRQKFFQAKNNQFRILEPLKMEICLPLHLTAHMCVEHHKFEMENFHILPDEKSGRGRHILPYSIAISLCLLENVSKRWCRIENVMQMLCPVAFSI